MKSLLRKRLCLLSVLLLTVYGQMWAGRSGVEGASGITNSIRYTLFSDYSYYYDDPSYSCNLGDVAVITSFDGYQMIIPETLGDCSQIVIGSGALSSNVRDLQISKSVKLLEFNAVYNATNIESLTIADGTTLVCFGAGTAQQSMQNGSFSYLKKLQSVYLGGNLEYDDYSTKYNAPFYNLNTEQAFSLTIGPNVTSIPEDCFGNCDDIKWIKAMPHTPPTLGYNALGTSNAVPVYVSYKTKSAYTSASGWSTFTNYVLDIELCKADAIAELTEAKDNNPSGAADGIFNTYKEAITAATSTDDVIAAKEEGIKELQEYVATLKAEKESAKAELDAAKSQYPSEYADNIVSDCKVIIEDATTIEDVKKAKKNGIEELEKEYNNLQNTKNAAIAELDKAKKDYPSGNASSIVAEGKNAIENAKKQSEVIKEKEYYIAQLMTAFMAELTNAKNDAINALNQAKDEYPSDAAEGIVSTYTGKIHAATSTDAVTAIKNEGIQALAYAAEMPTVLHINFAEGSAPIEKEHFMTASKFTLDEDCNVVLTVNDNSVTYPWDMAGKITLFNGAPTVEIKANKDPNGSEYYTTFYSSLEAYTLPEGVKAYTATVDEKQDGVIILNEIKDGVVPAETAVVLISESDTYELDYCNYVAGDADNDLQGKDVETSAPANCYILSGTSKLGMGLYPWAGEGKKLSANKAYLQLTEASSAKAFTFVFDEETTSIHNSQFIIHNSENDAMYNLNGVRVNDSYKGIVIKNGKKTLKK